MDPQTLSNSLSNKSAVTVAAIFGVTRRTIYRWCKKYNVPRRVYGCPDRELLCRLEADCIFQKKIAMDRRFSLDYPSVVQEIRNRSPYNWSLS